ncbi:glycosyl hydrolase family 8 [Roseicitreum antarcticum]|uniref:cellulase n=1 Tax=Roseicitreum antarcticum TaxID=564137 RepID=A0A1H2XUN4_9RHOB|nr:glycosyl hydrolase family 8 [Roseicitreum antarcticum]SDW96164.1 endoglucanase [Roseicitreum antarcticum]
MIRRDCLKILGANLLTAGAVAPAAALASGAFVPGAARAMVPVNLADSARPLWQAWKATHLDATGRVIDRLQGDSSHSEGQGYGMVLATEFNDPEAFAAMFGWTEMHLKQRGDGLLSWRWLPGTLNAVPDRNNASDGDLFYAWALLRAARAFGDQRYLDRAVQVAQDLAAACIVRNPADRDRLVMLPASVGFAHDDAISVNPSYYMPLAMREVAAGTGVSALGVAAQDADALLATLAGGGLIPDWVDISPAGMGPSARMSANSGYEALRVPLFLIWSGMSEHPAVRQAASVYGRTVTPGAPVPTVMEPASGVVLESSPDAGYRALAGLVTCSVRAPGSVGADMPPYSTRQPYYPATLQMFAMIAANQILPECVPL